MKPSIPWTGSGYNAIGHQRRYLGTQGDRITCSRLPHSWAGRFQLGCHNCQLQLACKPLPGDWSCSRLASPSSPILRIHISSLFDWMYNAVSVVVFHFAHVGWGESWVQWPRESYITSPLWVSQAHSLALFGDWDSVNATSLTAIEEQMRDDIVDRLVWSYRLFVTSSRRLY